MERVSRKYYSVCNLCKQQPKTEAVPVDSDSLLLTILLKLKTYHGNF